MALGHCRQRIHSLGWSIVMFFLIYWACIDEPWVSLVTRVQSAIKKRSNLLKNVSFTQAGLHIWTATATTSINNEYTSSSGRWAKQPLQSFGLLLPDGPLLWITVAPVGVGRRGTPQNSKASPGEEGNPGLPVSLTDGSAPQTGNKYWEATCPSVATHNVPKNKVAQWPQAPGRSMAGLSEVEVRSQSLRSECKTTGLRSPEPGVDICWCFR